MSLISCPQCGKPVSDKASKCPHCGLELTVPYISQPQPIVTPERKPKSQKIETVTKKPRKFWPAFVAGLGCMAIIVAALWFLFFRDVQTKEAIQTTGSDIVRESADFPYNTYFTGTIGSTGNMTINSQGSGSYSYINNGISLTRSIKIKSFDKASGHLIIEGYDNSGNYVGQFDGYTKNNSLYSGVFTNYKGGTVEFRLEAQLGYDSASNQSSDRYVVIDGSELRLRLGPSTNADTFKWGDGSNRHPNKGERYRYLGESGDFYKIDYKDHELWVSKQYTYLE